MILNANLILFNYENYIINKTCITFVAHKFVIYVLI